METLDLTKIITRDLEKAGFISFLNKKNTLGLPQFHTQGVGSSVPDLFFYDPYYESEILDRDFLPKNRTTIRAGFLELKPGDHYGKLIEGAFNLTRYYGYFITEKAKFFINGKMVQNVDCFLIGTGWSRNGMIYKGDEDKVPEQIPFMSEKYNFAITPFTMALHSFLRYLKQFQRKKLRDSKYKIPANKVKTETGIMISKNPFDETMKVSYEYYAWMGNKMKPILSKEEYVDEVIRTQVKIKKEIAKAILIISRRNRETWLPKSQIKILENLSEDWQEIEIPRWLYKNKEQIFGNL